MAIIRWLLGSLILFFNWVFTPRGIAKEELLAGGRDLKVPCLRIEGDRGELERVYESTEIIDYLTSRFAAVQHASPAV